MFSMDLRRSTTTEGETLADTTQRVNRRTLLRGAVSMVGLLVGSSLLEACSAPTPASPTGPSASGSGAAPAAPAAASPAAKDAAKPAAQGATPAKTGQAAQATIVLPGIMVESMDPYSHSTNGIYPTWKHVIEPLVDWDFAKSDLTGILASSWKSQDPNTWIFSLKQGVKFHDGSDFTADDVVYSYTRIQKDPNSKQQSALANIDAVEAVDPHTLRLHTKVPDAVLPFKLTQRFITSKAAHDRLGGPEGDKLAIGTGPYKYKEWVPAQRFVVEKNDQYSGPNTPAVQTVVFRSIQEQEAAISALLNSEVDLITNVSPESVDRLQGNAHSEAVRDLNVMFLGMNSKLVPEFGNKLVRQAVSYAIDREAIVKNILQGRASVMDAPVGPHQYGYSPDLQPKYTYDPAKAKALLAQAGYPNGFDVEYHSQTEQYSKVKEISTAIAQMLNAVGIRAKLIFKEFTTQINDLNEGRLPFYIMGRGSVIDPSEYLHQYFRTDVTKRLGYSNPQVDAALLAEQSAFDPADRLKKLRTAMSLLLDEAPVAWLYQYQVIFGVNNRFDYQPNGQVDMVAWNLKPKG
jgi:peptide/nickel transport system substrate-binding protein